MRTSSKQLEIKRCVIRDLAIRAIECDICNHSIWLELYFKVYHQKRAFLPLARFCRQCVKSKEEAYNLTFCEQVTAHDVAINNQLRQAEFRRKNAEEKLRLATETFDSIVIEAVTNTEGFGPEYPFTMFVVTKIEGTLNKIGEIDV